jgi:hypothetical protein
LLIKRIGQKILPSPLSDASDKGGFFGHIKVAGLTSRPPREHRGSQLSLNAVTPVIDTSEMKIHDVNHENARLTWARRLRNRLGRVTKRIDLSGH